jgi:hypothetical protein
MGWSLLVGAFTIVVAVEFCVAKSVNCAKHMDYDVRALSLACHLLISELVEFPGSNCD